VTDVAPGYDHITSAIGGALAAYFGADFLCAVSPSEHLGLPTPSEVREGVIASKIAAHVADLARHEPQAWERDRRMSGYRKALDWDGQMACALDPDKIRDFRRDRGLQDDVCSMCGEYCAMKMVGEQLRGRGDSQT
jgi:phosphomethylpyrimidine synthase